jgi:Flp pilus assembly protein TadG
MVEFALIGPLFFLFVVVIIQGALYINAQATIDNTTREMTRAAAVCGTSSGTFWYRGQQYTGGNVCQSAALAQQQLNFLPKSSTSSVVVSACTGSSIPASGHCSGGFSTPTAVGDAIEVNVSYTYTFYLDPLMGTAGPTILISSSARGLAQQ